MISSACGWNQTMGCLQRQADHRDMQNSREGVDGCPRGQPPPAPSSWEHENLCHLLRKAPHPDFYVQYPGFSMVAPALKPQTSPRAPALSSTVQVRTGQPVGRLDQGKGCPVLSDSPTGESRWTPVAFSGGTSCNILKE